MIHFKKKSYALVIYFGLVLNVLGLMINIVSATADPFIANWIGNKYPPDSLANTNVNLQDAWVVGQGKKLPQKEMGQSIVIFADKIDLGESIFSSPYDYYLLRKKKLPSIKVIIIAETFILSDLSALSLFDDDFTLIANNLVIKNNGFLFVGISKKYKQRNNFTIIYKNIKFDKSGAVNNRIRDRRLYLFIGKRMPEFQEEGVFNDLTPAKELLNSLENGGPTKTKILYDENDPNDLIQYEAFKDIPEEFIDCHGFKRFETGLWGHVWIDWGGCLEKFDPYYGYPIGKFIVKNKLEEISKFVPAKILSLWFVSWLEHKDLEIHAALLSNDKKKAKHIFKKIQELTPYYPISSVHSDRYSNILRELKKLQKEIFPPISKLKDLVNKIKLTEITGKPTDSIKIFRKIKMFDFSSISNNHKDELEKILDELLILKNRLIPVIRQERTQINPSGISRDLLRFIERDELDSRLAPTHALIHEKSVRGKKVIGLIQQDANNPNTLKLLFDVELSIDPWLKSLAAKQLAENGEKVLGMFSDWKLSSPKWGGEGINNLEVSQVGNLLQITLTLEKDTGNLALWRLGSDPGLPISLIFKARVDENITGELPLTLSFAKRRNPKINIKNKKVTNEDTRKLSIEYFMVGDRAIPLHPALTIAPGGSVNLAVPNDIDHGKGDLKVPPHAITYTGMSELEDFDINDGGGLMQTVQLKNLLGFDEKYGGSLDIVDVTVTYIVGDGDNAIRSKAGPFSLSSRGSYGSEIQIPFIKPKHGRERFLIEGRAYYDNKNSHQTIKPTEIKDNLIYINESLFE